MYKRQQQALLAGGAYTPETPAAVVYKASWPEQKVVRCTVGTLAGSTRANGITKTCLLYTSDVYKRQVANGVKNLVVQPTHLMHGAEYDEMMEMIDEYKDKFESVAVAGLNMVDDDL